MSFRPMPVLCSAVAQLLCTVALAVAPVRAQEPAVAEDPAEAPVTPPAAVLRDDISIGAEFPELARERLALPEKKAARDAYYRETFGAVLSWMRSRPAEMLQDAAHKYRRTRTRLSDAAAFHVAEDLRENIALYHLQPIQLYGTLGGLEPVTPAGASDDESQPWAYEGTLQVPGPKPLAVRLLVETVPAGLTEAQEPPVLVTGYLFQMYADPVYQDEQSDEATPLVVAPRLEWLRAEIDPDIFADVRDRTGLRDQERDAYYRTLVQARLVDLADQRALAREVWQGMQPAIRADRQRTEDPKEWQRSDKPYIDLFKNPELYRGRPVTLTGTLRQLVAKEPSRENEYDLTQLYDAWIFPDDSQGNPALVVISEKPESLELGDKLNQRVRVTGYFLKMIAYPAQDTTRVAPMILAGTIEPVEVPVPAEFPTAWLVGILGAFMLGVIGLLMYFRAKDRQFRREWREKHPDEPPTEFLAPPDRPPSE